MPTSHPLHFALQHEATEPIVLALLQAHPGAAKEEGRFCYQDNGSNFTQPRHTKSSRRRRTVSGAGFGVAPATVPNVVAREVYLEYLDVSGVAETCKI